MQPSYASQDYPFKLWQRFDAQGVLPRWQDEIPSVNVHGVNQELVNQEPLDCVVVAAGIGSRMHADRPKQYLMLGGHTILEWTVCQILQAPSVQRVVLVLHPEDSWFKTNCLAQNPYLQSRIVTVTGGKERVDSVLCGLHAVESTWCLVHDAARPFVNVADIESLIASVRQCSALGKAQVNAFGQAQDNAQCKAQDGVVVGGILAQPETDTLKRRCGVPSSVQPVLAQKHADWGFTHMTEDRSQIARAQTPQMFRTHYLRDKLTACLAQGKLITDEASVVDSSLGAEQVLLIPGSNFNFKITTPEDLVLAEALVEYMQRS